MSNVYRTMCTCICNHVTDRTVFTLFESLSMCTKLIKLDRSEKNKVMLRNVSLGVCIYSARNTGCVRMRMMKCTAFLSTFEVLLFVLFCGFDQYQFGWTILLVRRLMLVKLTYTHASHFLHAASIQWQFSANNIFIAFFSIRAQKRDKQKVVRMNMIGQLIN